MIEIIISENDDIDGRPLTSVHFWMRDLVLHRQARSVFGELELTSFHRWCVQVSRGRTAPAQLTIQPAVFPG